MNKILQLRLLHTQGHTRAHLSAFTVHSISLLEFLPLSLITSQQSFDLSLQDSQTVQFPHESWGVEAGLKRGNMADVKFAPS